MPKQWKGVMAAVAAVCTLESPVAVAPSVVRSFRETVARGDRVEILWRWEGLGPRQRTRYDLAYQGGRVIGADVPEALFRQFLMVLAEAPLAAGPYQPRWDHFDDYPFISIVVGAGGETVNFYTESQGRGHVPWAVEVAGRTVVVPSDAPQKALDLLVPRLEPDPEVVRRIVTPPSPPPPTPLELLHAAIQRDDLDTVRRLVAATPVLANVDGRFTPLHNAAARGRLEMAELFVRTGAAVDATGTDVSTPLAYAAQNGHPVMVGKLLELGAGRDASHLASALGQAARNGHADIVRQLISAGAEVNRDDEHGWRPIMCTLVPETLRLLVAAGADVNARRADGATPLTVAVQSQCGQQGVEGAYRPFPPPDRAKAIRLLIAAGAAVNAADDRGRTALMWASNSTVGRDPDVLEALLSARADVNARDALGRTALFYAAAPWTFPDLATSLPHDVVVRMLLDAGADVRVADEEGKTVLELVLREHSPDRQRARGVLERAMRR